MGESKKSVGDIVAGPHPAAGVIGGLIFNRRFNFYFYISINFIINRRISLE
jgi:hypothetical protein